MMVENAESAYRSIVSLLVISILFGSTLPLAGGYSDTNEVGQDSYEIIVDVPWRVEFNKDIPVMLMIHDAHKSAAKSIPLKEVEITIQGEGDVILTERILNASQLGEVNDVGVLVVGKETWMKEVIFTKSDLRPGGGREYIGPATVKAVFTLLSSPDVPNPDIPDTPPVPMPTVPDIPVPPTDVPINIPSTLGPMADSPEPPDPSVQETRVRAMEIVPDSLSSFSMWHFGDAHVYSNYTETRAGFGAPIEAYPRPGRSVGLDYIMLTDNSTCFTSQSHYDERSEIISAVNLEGAGALVVPAQEVVCYHDSGGLPPVKKYGKLLSYGMDYVDSTFDVQGNSWSVDEMVDNMTRDDGALYITDYYNDDAYFSPWSSYPSNLTGIEVWRGDDPYKGDNLRLLNKWTSLLLEGERPFALAGSGAYGDFSTLGRPRTLAYVPGTFSGSGVVEALRDGHTILTNGPLASFTVANGDGDKFMIGANENEYLAGKNLFVEPRWDCGEEFGDIDEVVIHIGEVGGVETEIELNVGRTGKEVDITPFLPLNTPAYVRLTINSSITDKSFHGFTNPTWVMLKNQFPRANAGEDIEMSVGEIVYFEGRGLDADGTIVNYEWDFDGDGTYDWFSATTGDVEHIYDTPGTYGANFRITDDGGLKDVDTCNVTIVSLPGNTAPVVELGDDIIVEEGTLVTLEASVLDVEGDVVSVEWTENGLVLSESLTLAKVFSPGHHQLKFTATDSAGLEGSDTVGVTVTEKHVANIEPIAVLKVSHQRAQVSQSVTFEAGDSTDEDGSILKYKFIYGDGTSSEWQDDATSTYSYSRAGIYNAKVQVKDNLDAIGESNEHTIRVFSTSGSEDGSEDVQEKSLLMKVKGVVEQKYVLVIVVVVIFIVIMFAGIRLKKRLKREELIFTEIPVEDVSDTAQTDQKATEVK